MKITLLNARTDGGAFVACLRLYEALLANKANEPTLFVQKITKLYKKNPIKVFYKTKLQKLPYLINYLLNSSFFIPYRLKRKHNFSCASFGVNISRNKVIKGSEVIHLHWINDNFISLKGLYKLSKQGKPIFWTLHDLWPITGGCHYNNGCINFYSVCGNCPELSSSKEKDLSYSIWSKKHEIFGKIKPTFIAPSKWMAEEIKNSSLGKNYNVHVIPYCIDHQIFTPKDQLVSRKYFNLPKEKRIFIFGAVDATNDERKGFKELTNALKILEDQYNLAERGVELAVFGNKDENININLNTQVHLLGKLNSEEALANCYNAADFLVIPSKQDNLPNTVMEALACGLPSIGFQTGGIPDMIDHQQNGFLAENGSSEDLANQMLNAIQLDKTSLNKMKDSARQKVLDNYTYDIIAQKHIELYQKYLTPSSQF